MNKKTGTLLVGALLAMSAAANAATTIEAGGLSLTYLRASTAPFGMTLLSADHGTVSVLLSPQLDGDERYFDYSAFSGVVQQGYRITSMTFSASTNGSLLPGVARPCPTNAGCDVIPGAVTNTVGVSTNFGQTDGGFSGTFWHQISGATPVSTTLDGVLEGEFDFYLETEATSFAPPTYQLIGYRDGHEVELYYPSTATVGMRDMTLTFQIAAVPEPGTYAMLLGGMALIGVAARRRKANAAV